MRSVLLVNKIFCQMFHKQYRQHKYSGVINNDTCDCKAPCCFIKNKVVPLNTIKAYESAYVFCHSFLTSALDVGEWSTSCPGQHPPPGIKSLF